MKGSHAVTPPLSMAKGHNQNASADGNAAVPSPLQGRMFQKRSPFVLASAKMHCSGGNVKLFWQSSKQGMKVHLTQGRAEQLVPGSLALQHVCARLSVYSRSQPHGRAHGGVLTGAALQLGAVPIAHKPMTAQHPSVFPGPESGGARQGGYYSVGRGCALCSAFCSISV